MADRFGPGLAAVGGAADYAVLDFGFDGFVLDPVDVFVPSLRKFDGAFVDFQALLNFAVADCEAAELPLVAVFD